MRLGQLIREFDAITILDSVLPGRARWDKYMDKGGDCRTTCPHYQRCNGWGPSGVCGDAWGKSEATPRVLDVLFHVLNHFEYYNCGDLRGLTNASESVANLRADVFRMCTNASGNLEEGDKKLRTHYYRERNSRAARRLKKQAVSKESVVCAGCDVDYFARYDTECLALIECHHKIPLSKAEHQGVTREEDLILLCANCHRLVHSPAVDLDLEKLRAYVQGG